MSRVIIVVTHSSDVVIVIIGLYSCVLLDPSNSTPEQQVGREMQRYREAQPRVLRVDMPTEEQEDDYELAVRGCYGMPAG